MSRTFRQAGTLRRRVYNELDPAARKEAGLSETNKVICGLIIISIVLAIVGTEPDVAIDYENAFGILEWIFTGVFLVEYVLRVWVCVENAKYQGWIGRIRYVRSPIALVDLIALAPILLSMVGSEIFLLRIARLIRIFRLARLGHFTRAMSHIRQAIVSRRYELTLSICVALLLLIVSSVLLYLVEGEVQPKGFGSIPRSMWWAIATLTTVGYGDVYPITGLGRFIGAVTAVTGIGMIAMPTGILAAAFSDAMQRDKAVD